MLLYGIFICIGVSEAIRNDETFMKVPQLIAHYGYPHEEHHVSTEDGYILGVHRIPIGRDERPAPFGLQKRPIVLLMHCLLCDSSVFVMNLPAQSLGFVLADAGFDVWMANTRGNEYGMNHTRLKVKEKSFWNFTWYDHSRYDLKNTVEYVLNISKQEDLYYIGHSQGTLIMFARLAEDPGFNSKVRAFFGMGPIGGLSTSIPILYLASFPFYMVTEQVVKLLSGVPIDMPHFLKQMVASFCSIDLMSIFCNFFLRSVGMGTEQLSQFNNSRWDVFVSHLPSPSSALNLLHWAQVMRFHELRKLDFGTSRNMEIYGQKQPPLFNLSMITTPLHIFWSMDDTLAPSADVQEHIIKKLGSALKGSYALSHFTHIDFILGLRATEDVYVPIIRLIYKDLAERAGKGVNESLFDMNWTSTVGVTL